MPGLQDEMEKFGETAELKSSEIEKILNDFPDEPISLHKFVKIISKFGGFIGLALEPIEKNLDQYPSDHGKKIIQGFAKRFISLDTDVDGSLTEVSN